MNPKFGEKICAACGSERNRPGARFCLDCGKLLFESYQPLDRLRSSYRMQGRGFAGEAVPEVKNLFEQNRNPIAQTAWASCVYSMVPYLGVIFIPFTVIVGCIALIAARRRPLSGGGRLARASITVSLAVLVVQLFLWWLLYFIPQISASY